MERWIALGVMLLMGLAILAIGIWGIRSRKAVLPGRLRLLLRLFGIEEVTGTAAVRIGCGQCAAGVLLVLGALTGPFWAGSLAENNHVSPVSSSNSQPQTAAALHGPPDASQDAAHQLPERSEMAPPQPADGDPTEPETPAADPLPPLGLAEQPLPALDYAAESVLQGATSESDPGHGQQFDERAPEGGLLVGMRVSLHERSGGFIEAVQAIYQIRDRYELGSWQGSPGMERRQLLAPPGYAVGRVRIRQGLLVDAIQLEFHRVSDKGLDSDDRVVSDWVGGQGGEEQQLKGGRLVVGIRGSLDDQLLDLGIQYLPIELGEPAEPLPVFAYDPALVERLELLGHDTGNRFEDTAPDGGRLVGVWAFTGKNWGGALQAVRPIYQVEDRYVEGKLLGTAGGEATLLLGQAGYAVGGLNVRSGLVMNAFQLVYMQVQGDRLESGSASPSEWVGSDGGSLRQLNGGGRVIVGLFGNHQDDLLAIGLIAADESQRPLSNSTASRLRTWTSADGRFSVQAEFVARDGDRVTLEREDGHRIEVNIQQLGAADRQYLRDQR